MDKICMNHQVAAAAEEAELEVPPYFLCPISLQIMKDPVTVSTGITYERENIEKWVSTNKNKAVLCPVTKQPLTSMDLVTPNHTLRRLIQSWCTLHASSGIERFPTPKPPTTQSEVLKLIRATDRAAEPTTKSKCLKKLKSIAAHSGANKRVLESAGAVEFLSSVIVSDDHVSEEALSVLSQLKISEERMRKLDKSLFDSLARIMSRSSSDESRACTVELMKSLMDCNPAHVGTLKQDHLAEVVQVLKDRVSPRATRAALKVLALACSWGRNRVRSVEAGAVPVLIELLMDATTEERRLVEMALAMVDQLCACAEGRAALLAHAAGIAVVSKKILRVSHFASDRGVRIIASVAKLSASQAILQEMAEHGVVTKLCLVLQVECDAKTKERCREVLKLHARVWRNYSPCAPLHVLNSF